MHKPQTSIAKNPLIQALAAEYAHQIKLLKEEQEAEIENLYCEFRRKYQCLKRIIEDQEGEAPIAGLAPALTPGNPCYRVRD